MTTTLLLTTGGILCAFVGIYLGSVIQCRIDNKELERFLFRARKQGFEEGYERGIGRKDSNVVNY